MAKAGKIKSKSFLEELWDTAWALRGDSIEKSQYKFVVLNLFFLKYANGKFETRRKEILEQYGEDYLEVPDFYESQHVCFLPKKARWEEIQERKYSTDLASALDEAFEAIEQQHPKSLVKY